MLTFSVYETTYKDIVKKELEEYPNIVESTEKDVSPVRDVENEKLHALFQNYLFSSKNDLNVNFNMTSFCPIIAPKDGGKSVFIKKAIQKFIGDDKENFNK